ncbi:hypothetical protein HLB23_11645 [Nocardia uniformis]|uniref:Uncharacterized protein n=1 Tax=Nocardia uniformis TaxID=53432 RepID=A0A849BZ11_9NOCA|nr:hypothetical protein [Nocardia uniformis]NNH70508.1 hypothetical protein [Nocardia uniformis]
MSALRIARWGILAVLVVLAAGCGAHGDPPPKSVNAELGAEFTLAPGSTGHIDSDRVQVLFREVTEDSRCPVDVDCVWPGDAAVVVTVTVENAESEHELHSNPQFTTAVTVEGYHIRLVDLEPSPWGSKDVAPDAYRVDLLVTRA